MGDVHRPQDGARRTNSQVALEMNAYQHETLRKVSLVTIHEVKREEHLSATNSD